MTLRSDGRRVISATMQPELYEQLYAHCKELDIPITVFVREAISRALPPKGSDLLALARAATGASTQRNPSAAACAWSVLSPSVADPEPHP